MTTDTEARGWTRRALMARAGALALGAGAAAVAPISVRAIAEDTPETLSEWLRELPLLDVVDGFDVAEAVEAPLVFSALSVRAPRDADVRVRTAEDYDGAWSEWVAVPRTVDEAPDPGERTDVTPRAMVWVGTASAVQLAVRGASLDAVEPLAIDSLGLNAASGLLSFGASAGTGAPVAHAAPQPPVSSRAAWGANEGWRRGGARYASSARYAFVHHTVTSNSYSRAEAPGVVRAIYRHHTQTNGWRDIGYNFLVDRHGGIYEGRYGGIHRPVIGAHAGGFNSGSIGVALIGSHTSTPPSDAAMASLRDLLAWLFTVHGVDPRATTVETSAGSTRYGAGQHARFDCISGHRDASATACPGDAPYARLDALRSEVAERMGPPSESGPIPSLPRLGGQDAIATAVLISASAFASGTADRVVLVGDRVFADAATAGPLAGRDGPVLINRPDMLDDRVADEIERVLPEGRTVYVLGGPTALSLDVERRLARRWRVRRLSGLDRTSSAAAVAHRVVAERGNRTALIARATPDSAWSDALAAGAYGARHGTPLLLTDSRTLSPATAAALVTLRIDRTIVVGGTRAISDRVMRALPNPTRVAGAERSETAAALARRLWGSVRGVIVASGYAQRAWRDPLVVAPLAAARDAPVLVVDTDTLPPGTERCLSQLSGNGLTAEHGLVIGGRGAVGDGVATRCAQLLG